MRKPNIIYIYADDLGRGMLSCYGQRQFKTPNIDRLAGEGIRFTRSYGTAFCAPARASLLTGVHDAHAGRWTFTSGKIYQDQFSNGTLTLDEISELITNTGIRPCDGQLFLPGVAKAAGYVTGEIGKLEWGFSTCDIDLRRHGWDYHYGYYDHNRCHGFYPSYLFENGDVVKIAGNTRIDCGKGVHNPDTGEVEHDSKGRSTYSQDLFDGKIIEFIRKHRNEPFFLFHPSQLPHGPTYYPEVFPEVAANNNLTPVEKEYASMVLRLDQTVGLILDELDQLGLAEDTLVLFSSDNGHEAANYIQTDRSNPYCDLRGHGLDQITRGFTTESCGDVFNGNDGMTGLKWTNWEGGGRIPFIARWPGKIAGDRISDHFFANYDTMATFADLLDVTLPMGSDGISYLHELLEDRESGIHDHIVFASEGGPAMVTRDGWKLRTFVNTDWRPSWRPKTNLNTIFSYPPCGDLNNNLDAYAATRLYYLPDDYREEKDLSTEHPDILHQLRGRLLRECDGNLANGTPNLHFAFMNVPQNTI